jgi:prepilin-type N-terminal cleavage/methylation domain-containing protein
MLRHYNSKSFTLIETLLGLAIFSVIAVGLYGVLSGAIKIDGRVKRIHQHAGDVRTAFDIVSTDLENALAYPFVKGSSDRLAFEGGKDSVSFFLPTDGGIVQVDYYAGDIDFGTRKDTKVRRVKNIRESFEYEKGEKPRQFLVRRSMPLVSLLSGSGSGVSAQALCGGLSADGLRLRYGLWEKDAAGIAQLKIEDKWKDNRLPDVIYVELQFEGSVPGRVERVRREIYPVVTGPVI